ncbi:MAG: DPP IV N-terminal domain-containing protein [Bernardetiaceae bacterium]|nr:DPP IV N-terminal domain-containing protein [Bernardetiaceae bacterium]
MKKINLFLLLWLGIGSFCFGQQGLSIEDATLNYSLYPESRYNLQWRGDSYLYTDYQQGAVIQGEIFKKIAPIPLIGIQTLNEKLPKTTTPLSFVPSFEWISNDEVAFLHDDKLFLYNLSTENLELKAQQPADAAHTDYARSLHLAAIKDHNLWVCQAGSDTPIPVGGADASREITYGESAHRNEFGIKKGTFWSPDGEFLAFYRVDHTPVTDYALVNYETTPAGAKPIKYPMAGAASHHAQVGVYNVQQKTKIYLQTGEPKEQYLTNISWSPDSKTVYVAVIDRNQRECKLNAYDAQSGKFLKTLFIESDEKYIEPQYGMSFIPNNPKQFIWQSRRDGFNHLYLYDTDGKMIRQLSKGKGEVSKLLGFDEKSKEVFFMAAIESPLEQQVYASQIANGKQRKITKAKGVHDAILHPSGKYLIDTYSNLETPNRIEIIDTEKGNILQTLLDAKNPLLGYKTGEISLHELKADDGTTLYARMIKPVDFDPNKKYPVMLYVYGGPHVQLIENRWMGGANLFMQFMANQGYVVFTLDNRGSSGRGLAFEQATFRNLGQKEMADQMQGVAFLKSQNFVDAERIGVHGWSYGGFMTISLMTTHSDIFKAGVAGGPVIDWKFYEIMYTERYMDSPEQNPEGYAKTSLLDKVHLLRNPLLIIHGLQDDVVVPQHTRAFVNECIKQGVLLDYFPYPNHEHNVRGRDRLHLNKKIYRYFEDYLK